VTLINVEGPLGSIDASRPMIILVTADQWDVPWSQGRTGSRDVFGRHIPKAVFLVFHLSFQIDGRAASQKRARGSSSNEERSRSCSTRQHHAEKDRAGAVNTLRDGDLTAKAFRAPPPDWQAVFEAFWL
jgi:hypothetical protein